MKKINSAFISVFNKENLEQLVSLLIKFNIKLYSSGGTKIALEKLGCKVISVEDITQYPSILGGRVKTLHPKIFGGILNRRDSKSDLEDVEKYDIPSFDLVIVDLYPFEDTVKNTTNENEIIEKIDIGGISLIRAAAKNYKDVMIIPSKELIPNCMSLIEKNNGHTSLDERLFFAKKAFEISSHYDTNIFSWFGNDFDESLKISISEKKILRYGENPHQKGIYYGNLGEVFNKLNGKEISYNNLLDIDAAINLINDCKEPTFAILKHNNACGIAIHNNVYEAWKKALAGDPISAFGGILITNQELNSKTAESINKLFFEIIISPKFSTNAFDILKAKKNRIILELMSQNKVDNKQYEINFKWNFSARKRYFD